MAKAKKTALNISTGKDKSTKAQRKRAYTVAVLITVMIITVGMTVACDNAAPSVSSVQGSSSSVYNWKEKDANTEWSYEEGKDSFSGVTDEQLLALLDCDHMKIESNLKLTFSGGFFGGVTSFVPLVFDEVPDGEEQSNGSVQIAGMTFMFHFSKTETEKRVKLWLNDDVNKYLLYKQVGNNK